MAYSDDESEGGAIKWSVTNYHFEDDEEEPICFSVLPIQWSERKRPETTTIQKVFLRGTADSGLKKIHKHVIAWKLELSYNQPEISVLSKENIWIKLLKPRKSFENTIRTILITVHYLHFLKKNPQTSGKSLWDHLRKVFSSYGVKPSESDLLDHLTLIRASVKQDRTLAKSKFLLAFVENPMKRKSLSEDICTGLVAKKAKVTVQDGCDNSDEMGSTNEDDSEDNTDPFDTACCMCDNGGDLLVCEGRCFRSFHATVDSGVESNCKSLGLSNVQVEAIQKFLCLNCQYKQHQCFVCGKLGSSDKSSGTEVFRCDYATCGHFYHPKCAAELLHPGDEVKVKHLQKKIADGESFTCPVHRCLVCKEGEDQEDEELQFAVCRRCPRAYHRKCLPRKIAFEDSKAEGIIQRAWDDLLPNRILVYCLKHKIDKSISTPARDHIIFPDVEKNKKTSVNSIQGEVVTKKRVLSEEFRRDIAETTLKQVRKGFARKGFLTKEKEKQVSRQGLDSSEKLSLKVACEKPVKDKIKCVNMNANKSCPADARKVPITKKSCSSQPVLDAEAKKRVLAIMKQKAALITLEDIMGKVDNSVEVVRTATENFEEGSFIEEVKAVSEPEAVNHQVVQTATENLEEGSFLEKVKAVSEPETVNQLIHWKVMEKLHCYVQNGDTIIDICCGTNEFTRLMKQKLEETGKKCAFKHYGVKNGLKFENRDWMSVNQKELPTGSQLIMVLNLFFEVEAASADKFIRKVLEFKPKLFIIITVAERERLDEKEVAYDLVWEDTEKLSDKSYFSGYNDMTDEQMKQWNLKPPLLHLWSRPDWTAKHKNIAQRHGHMSKKHKNSHFEENHKNTEALIYSRNGDSYCLDISNQIIKQSEENKSESEQSLAPEHNPGVDQSDHEDDDDKEGKGVYVSMKMKEKPVEDPMDRQDKQTSVGTGKTSQEGTDSFDNKRDGKNLLVPSKAQSILSRSRDREEVAGQLQLVPAGSGSGEPFLGHVKDNADSSGSTHHSKDLEKFRREADGNSQTKAGGPQGQGSSTKTQSDGKSENPRPISSCLSTGFAPGLLRPLTHQYRSGGWLDE